MSNTESFISEVTEEMRRDKLYAFFRRYAWVGALAIAGIVGGVSYFEYRDFQKTAEAERAGDALARAQSDESLYQDLLREETPSAFLSGLGLASKQIEAGDLEAATQSFDLSKEKAPDSFAYQDLIALKSMMTGGADLSMHLGALRDMATPGRPYRLLAGEMIALEALSRGDNDAAISGFRAILEDAEASETSQARLQRILSILELSSPEDGTTQDANQETGGASTNE